MEIKRTNLIQSRKLAWQASFCFVLFLLILYFFAKGYFFNFVIYFSSFAISLYFMWKAAKLAPDEDKNENKSWVKHPFYVFALSSFIYYINLVSLVKFDAELPCLMAAARENLAIFIYGEGFGVEGDCSVPSMTQWIFRYIFGLLGGFVLSFLVVLIQRKNR